MRYTIARDERPMTWEILGLLAEDNCRYIAFPVDFPSDLALAFTREYDIKFWDFTQAEGIAVLRW